ncbi:MAG: hypothetical protein KME23_21615 [Goleter apudmare HA4340-LM2]|jgi:hypothetical protein|nr:hypothetical protein [Goleter apudmare HA4340-LM2]
MMEISKILNQFCRQITIVILTCLVWIISLPTTPVQADGYYSAKDHKVERNEPYYSLKERRVRVTETARPYYSTKDRKQERVIKTRPGITDDYIDTGRRAGELTPQDLKTGNRSNNFNK